MEIDQFNNRLIFIKPNRIGEFNIALESEFEQFAEIAMKPFKEVMVDYKLRQFIVVSFLDGFSVRDMDNGKIIDKLSKDYKGILTCNKDDNSYFIGTTQNLIELNKNNGKDRKLMKNVNVKHIHICNDKI